MLHLIASRLRNKSYKTIDGLPYWREKILNNILLMMCIFGLFAYILGVYLSIVQKLWVIAIIDSLAYSSLLFLFISDYLSIRIRIYFVVTAMLVFSVLLLIYLGPYGAGLIYLLGFSILTSILLGMEAAILSLIVEILILILLGVGISFQWFTGLPIQLYSLTGWVTVGANIFVISSISSIPLAVLVNGLKSTNESHQELLNSMETTIVELSKAKSKAEESDELKSMFLANLSHEIRTPLNAIQGFSELILKQKDLDEPQKERFQQIIQQNVHSLIYAIENTLNIALIETNQIKYLKSRVSLDDFFKQVQASFTVELLEMGYDCPIFEQPDSPTGIIYADPERIKQVLANFINNSLKFAPHGTLIIGYKIESSSVKFYVKDNGPGIPEHKQKFIFDRFTSLEHENSVRTGTGLGLAINKGIVEAHHGRIGVESELQKGSTFYFILPLSN